ncbi:putative Ig domain-containing protein [Sanguibacter massiliensis]|uniref:putative Ig domain-containing protein n=1 Tax=Sanguibacter massiliensis TaxID=1973217 RepID=UPI0013EC23C4|nr:putative Ig domain-containing protein [Sanguibacter massiliensis]
MPATAVGAVAFDDFAGAVRGTRTVDTVGDSTFAESGGSGVVRLNKGQLNETPLVALTYTMSPTDLLASTNGQLFLDLFDVEGGRDYMALSITAVVTDANGGRSTYNAGIGPTPSHGFVFNYACTAGQSACFKGNADLGNITRLSVEFRHGNGNAAAPAVTFRIAGITSTPLGGARPAAPVPTIIGYSPLAISADARTATWDIEMRSGATPASLAGAPSAAGVTVDGGTVAVVGNVLRVTADVTGSPAGAFTLVVPQGAATDTWGQASVGASLPLRYARMPAPSWNGAPERGTLVDEPLPSALTRWVRASGATSLTHMISSGALPSGVSLSQTGVLQGTPSSSGTFAFTVAATDTYGVTREKQFTLKVLPTFQVGSTSVSWPVGSPFTLPGPAVPTDADVSLSLEPAIEGVDVEVAGARAQLRGTLSEAGTFTSELVVRRTVGPDTIVVGRGDVVVDAGEAPVITVTQPTGLRVGYPVDVVVARSSVPVTGAGLPAGLTLVGTTELRLIGTPTAAGPATLNLMAQNRFGYTFQPVQLTVGAATRPEVEVVPQGGATPQVALSGSTLRYDVSVTRDGQPWPVTGLDASDIDVTGATVRSIDLTGSGSAYTLVLDLVGWTDADLTVTVRDGAAIDAFGALSGAGSAMVTPWVEPVFSEFPADATVRAGDPLAWDVVAEGMPVPALELASALPPGLTFVAGAAGTATIAGTPTTTGTYDVTLRATHTFATVLRTVRVIVEAPRATTTVTPVGGPTQSVRPGSTVLFDVVQDAAGRVPVAGPEGLDADDVTTSGVDVSGIVVTPTATGHTIAVTLAPGAIDGELVVEVREGATVDPWGATSLPGAARLRVAVTEATTFAGVSLDAGLTGAGTAADPIRVPATGATSFGVAFAGRPAPSVTLVSVAPVLATAPAAATFGVRALSAPTALLGLTLTDHGDGTATIAGTLRTAGVFDVVVRGANATGAVDRTVRLVVAAPPAPEPTEGPTEAPTDGPTDGPTDDPTEAPTDDPTETPTDDPTETPTDDESDEPSTQAPSTTEPSDDDALPVTGARPLVGLGLAALLAAAGVVVLAVRRRTA